MSKVYAYTDGASANNQDVKKRVGGWAAVIMLVDEICQADARPNAYKELSGTMAGATNNQAELEAIRQVLLAFKREGVSVTIFTDSAYAIGVLAHHWKPTRNKELIAEIKSLMSKHSVSFEKVEAHSGNIYNELADSLAVVATHTQV